MNKKSKPVLNGVYETISELIGFDNTVEIYKYFAGSQINFPTRLFSKEFVLQEAIKHYDGTSESINKIAVKYKYSERTVRKLLKEHLESDDKWGLQMGRIAFTYTAQSNDLIEVEKELQLKIVKQKKLCQKIAFETEEAISVEDIYIATSISNIEKEDGTECFVCTIVCYNLQEYRTSSLQDLQEELLDAKEELEELIEELEEREDQNKDDFASEEEYKEKLKNFDVDMFLLETDIEVITKIIEEIS